MKVFIENEAGSNKKSIFNEKMLEFEKQDEVSCVYPYPYGFVLNTTAEDGDNVDCFALTDQELSTSDIVKCEPKALMEQKETSWSPDSKEIETDHNVIAVPIGEDVDLTDEIKDELTDFISHVFDHISDKKIRTGEFLHLDKKTYQTM
jgi:inorganic pyrophosphatase